MLLFPILVMRNMHDYGGGDIIVVTVNWTSTMLDCAFDHWAAASQSDWCQDVHTRKVQEAFLKEDKSLPCFHMSDQLVRALLLDKEVGYVPRFIDFRVKRPDDNTPSLALLTHPDYQPSPELIKDFPIGCGRTDPECVVFDFKASRALREGDSMVRKDKFLFKTVRCNLTMSVRGRIWFHKQVYSYSMPTVQGGLILWKITSAAGLECA
ncbi:hypothetical protein CPB83DRAFT_849170 [Crepidotus variabilis]|uniref:Uncharacterized protein n=1 Tax=Crepidotus variabilis TaxID=179855 RepID=A0A9P6EMD7_9AGAR|nr:hypothetical protein CPB83DRAFT_849170 [Crepidotus variabilis]